MEAQIISKEVYESVGQTKFVPIVMELGEDGKPCLPVFLQTRKYIDFSSPQKISENWEKLVRLLHGKPSRVKPRLGGLPTFLKDEVGFTFTGLRTACQTLKVSLMEGKPGVVVLRDEVLEAFCEELKTTHESLSTTDRSGDELIAVWERQVAAQSIARNLLIDWMLIEAKIDPDKCLNGCIIPLLESVAGLAGDQDDSKLSATARDAFKCLAYELSLYSTACLMAVDATTALKGLFDHPFPSTRHNSRGGLHVGLSGFYHYSKLAESWNSRQETRWISPLIQIFKNNASHSRLTFYRLVEAEALIFVFNVVNDGRYYPASAAYSERGPIFPWFLKAKTGKGTDRLAIITGKPGWQYVKDDLISKFGAQFNNSRWEVFEWGYDEYFSAMEFNSR